MGRERKLQRLAPHLFSFLSLMLGPNLPSPFLSLSAQHYENRKDQEMIAEARASLKEIA